uniref:Uncharacterized protein n=1 Tax=Arundo donax TaxID=35708 RepID=A0A0A8YP74_ARUDO
MDGPAQVECTRQVSWYCRGSPIGNVCLCTMMVGITQ